MHRLCRQACSPCAEDGIERRRHRCREGALGDALVEAREHVGEITLVVRRDAIVDVCRLLRDTPGLEYQQLMEIVGVDYPGARPSDSTSIIACFR